MEVRSQNNSVKNSDLVQIPSKAGNSDDFSVLFASPNGFKGDHRAPKGSQKGSKSDLKIIQISSKLHSGPGYCDQGFKGVPHWAKKGPKKAKLCLKNTRFFYQSLE